jgi:hypothetical protein
MSGVHKQTILTLAARLWSTLINVMRNFCANAMIATGIAGAISIPAIRISGHNVRAGIGA